MACEPPFTDVPGALADFKAGRMVVVVDDEDRENEGDLTLAAEFVTPEAINFMAKHGRGLICLTLTEERADYLRLGPMTQENSSRFGTAFTESIEAREGVTTGISASDRAHTIRVAIAPGSTAADLARPGHVFPLRARKGGVLVRAGQTEASVDMARMAGLVAAGVICEIMNDDGTMARVPDLVEFCRVHGLKMLTVAELIRYRLQHERSIRRAAESILPTPYGEFRLIAYESETDEQQSHVALVMGDVAQGVAGAGSNGEGLARAGASSAIGSAALESAAPGSAAFGSAAFESATFGSAASGSAAFESAVFGNAAFGSAASGMEVSLAASAAALAEPVLVRVHSHCLAGEVFGSTLCDCQASVQRALRAIAEAGRGALIYLHNGGRGFEIDRTTPKPHIVLHRTAHREQRPAETHDDRHQRILRQTGLGGQILSDLEIRRIRLMSNTPTHVPALQGFGVEIVEQVPVPEFGRASRS